MADTTAIAWTDHTFNPWMGCTKISPGCTNCYADTLTTNRMGLGLWGPNGRRQLTGEANWDKPWTWDRAAKKAGRSARVFCASLCDVFEDWPHAMTNAKGDTLWQCPTDPYRMPRNPAMKAGRIVPAENFVPYTINDARARLWALIRATPHLDWQLLTKRPERIADHLPPFWSEVRGRVWLGCSVESDKYVHRIDAIRDLDSAVRFISYEPALGPIAHAANLARVDWLIYGGESGPGYRPEDKQWARDAMALCRRTGTRFFHKQSAGARTEMGIELDGRIVREYPADRRMPVALV
jgi:protein gp37